MRIRGSEREPLDDLRQLHLCTLHAAQAASQACSLCKPCVPRDQDPIDLEVIGSQLLPDALELQPGIDHKGRAGIPPADQEAVLAKQLIDEDGHLERRPQHLGRGHPSDTSRDAGVRTSGPLSVTSTISSSRTPPQPGR